MRILLITADLPYPPASGGAIRTLGIVYGLHQHGHQITLLSFYDGKLSVPDTPLSEYCEKIITVAPPQRTIGRRLKTLLLSGKPDIQDRFYSEDFVQALTRLMQQTQFDLVQFEAIESAAYMSLVKQLQPDAKIVFDTFNAEWMLQQKIFEVDRENVRRLPAAIYSYLQVSRITAYERELCRLADAVIAVSDEDAELLQHFRKDKDIHILQSGVFVNDYAKPDTSIELQPNALVFTGKMDYRPNVDAVLWFAEAILPNIMQATNNVNFYIVGQKPHPRLDALRDHPNIHITGWVDSTQPYLHAADVYVAPLRMGSGTRLKLLEAMSSRCAIVATTLASAGLHAAAKNGMIVSDSPDEFATEIVKLLKHPENRVQLGETAHTEVRNHYDWSVLIPRLLDVYRKIGIG